MINDWWGTPGKLADASGHITTTSGTGTVPKGNQYNPYPWTTTTTTTNKWKAAATSASVTITQPGKKDLVVTYEVMEKLLDLLEVLEDVEDDMDIKQAYLTTRMQKIIQGD